MEGMGGAVYGLWVIAFVVPAMVPLFKLRTTQTTGAAELGRAPR